MGRNKGSKNRIIEARDQTVGEKQTEEALVRPFVEQPNLDIDVKHIETVMDHNLATPTIDSPMVNRWEDVGNFDTMSADILSKYESITGNKVTSSGIVEGGAVGQPAAKRRRVRAGQLFDTIATDEVPARSGGRNPTTGEFVLPPNLEDLRGKIYRYYQEFPHLINDKTSLFNRRWTEIQLENELERCRRALQPAATFQFLRQSTMRVIDTVELIGCQRGYAIQNLAKAVGEDPEFDLCLRQIMVEYNLDFSKFLRPELRLLWIIYGKASLLHKSTKKNTGVQELLRQNVTLVRPKHEPEAETIVPPSVPPVTLSV